MGKRILRLNESELTQLIKTVIMENPVGMANPATTKGTQRAENCMKPVKPRSECTQNSIAREKGGKIFEVEGQVVMMVKAPNGCPELCRVGDKEIYKLV